MQNTQLGNLLNKLLTGRLYLTALAIKKIPITWLGSIKSTTELLGGGALDSLYPYFFFRLGIITFVLFAIAFYQIAKRNKTGDNLLIIAFSIYAMSEHALTNYAYFCAILVISQLFKKTIRTRLEKLIDI